MVERRGMQESVTLTDEVVTEQGTAVQFTAHIPNNGIAGSTQVNIRNLDDYNTYRTDIRQIQREFQNDVWDREDAMNMQVEE